MVQHGRDLRRLYSGISSYAKAMHHPSPNKNAFNESSFLFPLTRQLLPTSDVETHPQALTSPAHSYSTTPALTTSPHTASSSSSRPSYSYTSGTTPDTPSARKPRRYQLRAHHCLASTAPATVDWLRMRSSNRAPFLRDGALLLGNDLRLVGE